MYQIFGLQWLLKAYGAVAGLVAVLALVVQAVASPVLPWEWPGYIWAPVATGLGGAAALLWLVGETPLFPLACRHRWACSVFPDLDGEWEGELFSNWPRIAQRGETGAEPAELLGRQARVTIKARLLSVSMALDTKDAYSNSKTVLAGVTRDDTSERCCLTYVYENRTPHPKQTDAEFHLGAAMLTLKKESGGDVLEGPYWTNRNWTKGLNTAGMARFRKIS